LIQVIHLSKWLFLFKIKSGCWKPKRWIW